MRINQLKIGTLISYLQMALSVIIGIIYTPIMIRLLGQSEYGLYNMVASTISMLSVLSLGFNSSYIRYYSVYKKNNDQESINKLNGLFLLIFIIIGTIAFICGIFLSFNLQLVFDKGLTKAEYDIAKVLMILLTVNLSVSFPASVFSNIISANERFVFLKLLGVTKTVLGPLVTLPLLLMGYRSIAMVTVTLVISLATDLLYAFYVIVILKNKFVFRNFEKGLFKNLFQYTFFIALNLIIDQINWNMDKFILGRIKGTISVAIYSVGYTLHSYYQMFSTAISGVFTPRIHKIVNTAKTTLQKNQSLTDLFIKVGRIQFIVLSLAATGLIFFGKPFIVNIWAGNDYTQSYYVALLLILPASIALIQNVGIEIQRALNLHQFRSIVYFAMSLINLVSSIFLAKAFGAIGAAIGTAFSMIVANGIIMNIYYYLKCNIDIYAFWKNIFQLSKGMIIPVLFGVVIVNFINMNNIVNLCLSIILYIIIYVASMWIVGMNDFEKNIILKPIRKIVRK